MELLDFSNGFLKVKQKETLIDVITKDKSSEIHTGESIIKSNDCEKLLDIKLIQNFIFDDHVKYLCKKANRNLRALAPATP